MPLLDVTDFNAEEANDFIKKYMQDNIHVIDISRDEEDGIYFVTLRSGKLFRRRTTHWQFRPSNQLTSKMYGNVHVGLCFGSYDVPFTNKRYDFYEFDSKLMAKANNVAWKKILKKWL